jgi:hypothetical protein
MAGIRRNLRTTGRAAIMLVVVVGIIALAYAAIRYRLGSPLDDTYTAAEISLFREAAFGIDDNGINTTCRFEGDCQDTAPRVQKWEEDILLQLGGEYSFDDQEELAKIAAELDDLIPGLSVRVTDDAAAANIIVGYRPWAELGLDGDQTFLGFTMPRGERFAFESGAIYVDSARPAASRRLTLRHEILHALGFSFHPYSHPKSVLSVGRGPDYAYPQNFSAADTALIRILYDSRVKAGMTLAEVEGLGF